MRVVRITQPGVDSEARCLKKAGKSVFGYKQHTVVDSNGLVLAVETTPANWHDSQPLAGLVDKADIGSGSRLHADKAYGSKKHRDALKTRGIKNGIQDKAVKNKPLSPRQLAATRASAKSALWWNARLVANSAGSVAKSCATRVWPKSMPGTSCWQSLTT
ncbi:MAG: transposase [Methylococcaceae bacterium]|jgi:IS5 family transposase